MKRKNIKEDIREYFFLNPTAKMRVRHIERKLKLPLPSVIRYCRELEKEGILKKESTSGVFTYSADRSSKAYLREKKLSNLKRLYCSGLIDFLTAEFSNPPIIVFGSYARGEDIEGSDIDLYVETPRKQTFNLEKFEKILDHHIQIFNYRNIKEVSNPHLSNNIINGIILNNFLEVFE